jgi:hypothetical protein
MRCTKSAGPEKHSGKHRKLNFCGDTSFCVSHWFHSLVRPRACFEKRWWFGRVEHVCNLPASNQFSLTMPVFIMGKVHGTTLPTSPQIHLTKPIIILIGNGTESSDYAASEGVSPR